MTRKVEERQSTAFAHLQGLQWSKVVKTSATVLLFNLFGSISVHIATQVVVFFFHIDFISIFFPPRKRRRVKQNKDKD